jgi:hypothetical protein
LIIPPVIWRAMETAPRLVVTAPLERARGLSGARLSRHY